MEDVVVTPQNPFSEKSWGENEIEVNQEIVEIESKLPENDIQDDKKEELVVDKKEEPLVDKKESSVDNNAYLKNKWEWDNEDIADAEIKTLREKSGKAFEYKNDESRKVAEYINEGKEDDLYDFLKTKQKINKLLTGDITNKKVAEELVKFGLKSDNPSLNDDEVDFLFDEKYAATNKPNQGDSEEDEDYENRVKDWQKKESNLEKKLVIEAKLNQPKLAKFKAELVLPDIQKEDTRKSNIQNQEELDRIEVIRGNFLKKLESDFTNFTGFEVKYKDEEGEVPINYVIPDDKKFTLKEEMKDFNLDGFIDERWFKDGQPNIKQMMEDISLLRDRDAVFQKLVNETGAQIRKQYIGIKANVHVTGAKNDGIKDNSQKSEMDKQIDFLWTQKY